MEWSRRQTLVAGTTAVAMVAGCSAIGSDDDGSEATSNADTPEDQDTRDGDEDGDSGKSDETGDTDAENEADEDDDGDEEEHPAAAAVVEFTDSVPEWLRERGLLAFDRLQGVIEGEIPETIEFDVLDIDPSEIDIEYDGTTEIVATATHREEPPVGFPGEFAYYSGGRVNFFSQQARDIAVDLLIDELPVDPPADPFEAYPDEPLIAHEFAHAIQFDTVDPVGGDGTTDGERAATSVLEGTAQYVAARYQKRCQDGAFDGCATRDLWLSAPQVPRWGIHQRIPYINGAVLAHRVREREGWDGLWEAHESPPETAWAAMFSGEFLEEGISVRRPTLEPRDPEQWDLRTEDTLGVNPLYEKLAYLGQVWPTDPEAQLSGSVTEETVVQELYRTALLRGWRGDAFRGYRHESTDEIAYRWLIEFTDASEAGAFADAIAAGYDARGSRAGEHWELPRGVAAVDQDGTGVVLTGAPSGDTLGTFR